MAKSIKQGAGLSSSCTTIYRSGAASGSRGYVQERAGRVREDPWTGPRRYLQGRYEKATPLYLQALEGTKKLLGADSPEVLRILCGLATVYDLEGRRAEAEATFREALQGQRKGSETTTPKHYSRYITSPSSPKAETISTTAKNSFCKSSKAKSDYSGQSILQHSEQQVTSP